MKGLLESIKVVDMGHVVAVPAAGRVLSDWGADVVKVEPLLGEYIRGSSRAYGVDLMPQINGAKVNFQFESLNTGKKGIKKS